MLVGLELASAYQWDLARCDLLDPSGNGTGPYGRNKVWPFVIVGSRPYADGKARLVACPVRQLMVVINLKTAKALGIEVPLALLIRADELVE